MSHTDAFAIAAESADHDDLGIYNFEVVVSLPQWPDIAAVTLPFVTYMDACDVSSYVAPSNLTSIYTVGDNQQTIDFSYA
jgi:hypothetical protein